MTDNLDNRLEVLGVGLLASIQDAGRYGQLDYGVTQGGAMDGFAYRLGQRLVSNPANSAAIEIAMSGFCCRLIHDSTIAITGAIVNIHIDGQPQPMNNTLTVPGGAEISISPARDGLYSYLSVAGGIATSRILCSRSTVLRDGIGSALTAGDSVPCGVPNPNPEYYRYLARQRSSKIVCLRYLPGFQAPEMTPEFSAQFQNTHYIMSNERDRMGIRLSGSAYNTGITQLWSEATCCGAIQIPPDGQPIVLLADRQTMGGYPKIGAVLSVDCDRLCQAAVGTTVRFKAVDPTEADRILWLASNYEQELRLAERGR